MKAMKPLSVAKFILNILQLLIGIALGLALIAGGSLAAGYYVFTKLTIVPQRPIFTEEKPKQPVAKSPSAAPAPAKSPIGPPSPASPSPAETETALYKGVINWSEGLILRDAPGSTAPRIGSVAYNQQVLVLEESPDQNWQRVKIVATGKTGWIKAGNIDKTSL